MKRSARRALVVGCGIAGPVLAMWLQRAGIVPVIYEGRPEPRDEAGAFLNLAPNGAAVLDGLGIGDRVLAAGTPTTRIVFHNHLGKALADNPETTTLLKRGALVRTLREEAMRRGVEIAFGKRLIDVVTTGARSVAARFEDGTVAEGDLLIGCDGINSRVRRSILPGAPSPTFTGVVDCGGFTWSPSVAPSDGLMHMTFGLRAFFGYQVVPSGEIYWFENFTQPNERKRNELAPVPAAQVRDRLLELHRDDHAPIPEIIRSTDTELGSWAIYDLPSLPSWHSERAVLIGDAAHAISPHVGQGASLAMEDAMVLARCLRDAPDVGKAFVAFESLRKERVERLVKQARTTGNQKVPSNGITRRIRDLVMPIFLRRGVKDLQSVYAYRVDWEKRAA